MCPFLIILMFAVEMCCSAQCILTDGGDSGTQTWAKLSPASDPSNHISVLISSPPRHSTWQRWGVYEFQHCVCSCATSSSSGGSSSWSRDTNLLKERIFFFFKGNVWSLRNKAGQTIQSPVPRSSVCFSGLSARSWTACQDGPRCQTASPSDSHPPRWCIECFLQWKWDRGGLFPSHSVSEIPSDVSPPNDKKMFCRPLWLDLHLSHRLISSVCWCETLSPSLCSLLSTKRCKDVALGTTHESVVCVSRF